MSASKRKEALAAAAAFQRALSEVDEVEAQASAARSQRDAAKAELEEVNAQLTRERAAAAEAEAAHQQWREASFKERFRTNGEIDRLQQELQSLQVEVAARRAESQNILDGIAALSKRLKLE